LEPFEALTKLFSDSQHGLAASIGPQVVGLLSVLKDALPVQSDLSEGAYSSLRQFHKNRIGEIRNRVEFSEELGLATALHPTFNNLWVYSDQEFRDRVLARLRSEYYSIVPPVFSQPSVPQNIPESIDEDSSGLHRLLKHRRIHRESSFGSDNGSQVDEVERYLQLEVIDEVDPLEWWKENIVHFPHLAFLARKYLAIPASSVSSERMFSYSGNIITDRHNRLADDAISDIVFCHYANKCILSKNNSQ
jgi:hypothetical protein